MIPEAVESNYAIGSVTSHCYLPTALHPFGVSLTPSEAFDIVRLGRIGAALPFALWVTDSLARAIPPC
jgi:hypothetical protein